MIWIEESAALCERSREKVLILILASNSAWLIDAHKLPGVARFVSDNSKLFMLQYSSWYFLGDKKKYTPAAAAAGGGWWEQKQRALTPETGFCVNLKKQYSYA